MRNKLLKIKTVFVALFFAAAISAQTIYITGQSESFNDVRKLTFLSGKLYVMETNNYTTSYTFKNTESIVFLNTTSTDNLIHADANVLTMFPNPTVDNLNISFNEDASRHVRLCVYDIDGKVVMSIDMIAVFGDNMFVIDVSALPIGLYMCQLNDETSVINGKFIKN